MPRHGEPCEACDGSCRLRPRGAPASPLIPPLSPSPPRSGATAPSWRASLSPTPGSAPQCVRAPASLPGGADHPEYGDPVSPRALAPRLAGGPGAFCAPPWRADVNRLAARLNRLFRCIATSSLDVSRDSRALRRVALDFYAMGYMHQRPSRRCWEALLQLTPEQCLPLRATLRAINSEESYEQRFLDPPEPLAEPLFGEECDVSADEGSPSPSSASSSSAPSGDDGSVFSPDGEEEDSESESETESESDSDGGFGGVPDSRSTGRWTSGDSDEDPPSSPETPPVLRDAARARGRGSPPSSPETPPVLRDAARRAARGRPPFSPLPSSSPETPPVLRSAAKRKARGRGRPAKRARH
ncbi:regulatory protein ICP22 [Equid alphaherpesvirus 3]|uniref:Transcriptional regulator ICP22 homolog n=1 Tax=Equid alphaherpesvirus 3 TaxID=80341 RepID=A0A077B9F3_9ALPH|nr:regulatory protein ICP22 [Equid alphaherpesvirus 3]YP_009054982.1 regulatory protein ICP22 [Equid alphaherpesvirus 3]AIL02982.1 regulatory protein ICP22 [Equid alphaherpesvirus 3]AIL02996.1 regulatory protein ICP22 [Equid alphaherpesvirus 3]